MMEVADLQETGSSAWAHIRRATVKRGMAVSPEPRQSPRDWKVYVPQQFRDQEWPLGEPLFGALAEREPQSLLRLVESGVLDRVDLSFALEALGRAGAEYEQVLISKLTHSQAVVREGAVCGLAEFDGERVRQALLRVARGDSSPGVRAAAEQVLAGL
jgi:hypothetical protein